ncbi:MAM and LDL-receptor class A domain-containing protein 1-like [Amphiura filiformis]|uniref:MAM and LDL-receptor class A domain-containing protein 1-like n=1 Tax=Amphiura filiformis TaxID=82378 RepID=UPI003B2234AA
MEAQRSFDVLGDIAIDDVFFSSCALPPTQVFPCPAGQWKCARGACIDEKRRCDLTDDCGDNSDESETDCAAFNTCDFEFGICNWEQLLNDELDWNLLKGITPTDWTGPTRDHTTGLSSGTYLYLESSSPRLQGDRARLGSFIIDATQTGECTIRFYYHMFGPNIGTLSVHTRDSINGPLQTVWSKSGNIGDFYERVEVALYWAQPFQVIIQATVGDGIRGDIAIDDVSFTPQCVASGATLPVVPTDTPTLPPTQAPPCGGFLCNNGECLPASVRCDGTPDCSDTSDEINCGYCDFETDQCGWTIVDSGLYQWARESPSTVVSPHAPDTDHTTGTANGYYMFVDSTDGTFMTSAILQSPQLGDTGSKCMMSFWYHMTGEDGKIVVTVYLNGVPDISRTVQGDTFDSWNNTVVPIGPRIAGTYMIRLEATPGGDFQNPSELTDITIDDIAFGDCDKSSDISCDFEGSGSGSICGWSQDPGDDFDWTLDQAGTGSAGTGPSFDHTTGTAAGWYMYIETSSPRIKGEVARFMSGLMAPTMGKNYCFEFWYHMFGPDIDALNVYLNSGPQQTLIYHKFGTQANEWRLARQTFSSDLTYEIIFEGIMGNSWGGDIAIDDVALSEGTCPASNECEFTLDFCGWMNDDTDTEGFDWQLGNNGDPAQGTGPKVDHTWGTSSGKSNGMK